MGVPRPSEASYGVGAISLGCCRKSSQAAGAKMWSENCLPACCKADQDGYAANGMKIRTETIFKRFLLVIPKFISYCDILKFFGRLMEHDKGRVELVAQAILKAVQELMETHCEVTLEATINRIVAYRIEEKDEFMKDIYRDAFLVLTQGEF